MSQYLINAAKNSIIIPTITQNLYISKLTEKLLKNSEAVIKSTPTDNNGQIPMPKWHFLKTPAIIPKAKLTKTPNIITINSKAIILL